MMLGTRANPPRVPPQLAAFIFLASTASVHAGRVFLLVEQLLATNTAEITKAA